MQCTECQRELKDDSKFCDQCGAKVFQIYKEKTESQFNTTALLAGILFSIFVTLLVMGSAQILGIPLIFGGLFLPFFWWRKKKS